ncbi:unnamed protein product, partial [Musa textilis]
WIPESTARTIRPAPAAAASSAAPRRAACALGATETSASWSSSRRWGRLWPQRSPRGREPEGRGRAVLLLPGRGAPEGGGPVRAVQEEGEAVREVRVPVREHVLRGAPPPGDARVRVRLQGAWPRGDRQGQPRRREGQAAEDLKKTQEY